MFENIFNFADLRKAYRDAARKAHPDMGGSDAAMQEVNAAYEKATKRIERTGERFSETAEQKAEREKSAEWQHQTTAADMAEYAEILQKLFSLDGLEIELCGSWLWISGWSCPPTCISIMKITTSGKICPRIRTICARPFRIPKS